MMKKTTPTNCTQMSFIKFIKRTKFILFSFSILILTSLIFQSCKQKIETTDKGVSTIPLDSVQIPPFFKTYPDLKKYEKELVEIYEHYDFNFIWFNQRGLVEYGDSLYSQVKNIKKEGIHSTFPYQKNVDDIFEKDIKNPSENPEADLMFTSLYLYYASEVYKGIDSTKTADIGWHLPRKKMNYISLLDSIVREKNSPSKDSINLIGQYYQLRNALDDYREIEKNGGWIPIKLATDQKSFNPKDSSQVIQEIRNRLYVTGELKDNNKSNIYDGELIDGVLAFQSHHGFKADSIISAEHISAMNKPVEEYIKAIVVNMERCRWIPPNFVKADRFLFVNIPAYELNLFDDGKIEFNSPVVVGNVMTKTVIFDGEMSYLAFSPYWNLPQSIIKNEVKPGLEKDKDYLKKRNMEWNDGLVRQLPGENNSLGLVKFMFPNSNSIYLHDTPAKSLFEKENRAMSHGCIRVEKARDLAITILKNDKEWTPEKIDEAMNEGEESTYALEDKIPVYIGYFTAWVDDEGQINFYKDIYERDERLAQLLNYK